MSLRPVTFDEQDLKKLFKSNTPLARFWKAVKRVLRTATWLLVVAVTIFAALNAPAFWQRANFASRETVASQPPIGTAPTTTVTNYEPEIIIDKIGVRAPVIYGARYDSIIENLRDGVVRYEGTADPGQIGNVVIVGHSSDFPWSTGRYKTIFALLDKLTLGDEIVLPYGTIHYVYKVTETKVVKPSNLSVLGRTPSPALTLITCYPVGTTLNRLVVIANLTEGPVGSIQTTAPFLGEQLTTAR